MRKLILLYNFSDERAAKIRRLALPMKMGVRVVEKKDYNQPIGVILGKKDFDKIDGEYEGTGFSEEMLLMQGLTGREIDALIKGMNKNGVGRIALKAVVTASNIYWDSVEVHNVVRTDHEEMMRRRRAVQK